MVACTLHYPFVTINSLSVASISHNRLIKFEIQTQSAGSTKLITSLSGIAQFRKIQIGLTFQCTNLTEIYIAWPNPPHTHNVSSITDQITSISTSIHRISRLRPKTKFNYNTTRRDDRPARPEEPTSTQWLDR